MPVTGAHLSLLNNESQVPKFPMPNVPEYPINLSALVPQVPESQSALSASITGASWVAWVPKWLEWKNVQVPTGCI